MPEGVTTSATATMENDNRELCSGFCSPQQVFSNNVLMKIEQNGDITIAHVLITEKVLVQEEMKRLEREISNIPIQKRTFSGYMASPCIHFKFPNADPRHITNQELIKRVANEYDGSHFNDDTRDFDTKNTFSYPVNILMNYKCARLPLPYFILLHVAKNIIENLDI